MPSKLTKQLIADFRLLEIPTNATLEELNRAFKIVAKKYHPDKSAQQQGAQEMPVQTQKMQELVAARDRLYEYFKSKPKAPSESKSKSSSLSESDSLATHHSVTSSEYFKYIFRRGGVLSIYKEQLHLDEGIPLDAERRFYVVFPFLNPQEACNPYAFMENMDNAKARYAHVYTDWEQAQESLTSSDLRMSVGGYEETVKSILQPLGFFASGIIYSLRGSPRIISECFARDGFDVLVPLITGYHIEKTKKMTMNESAIFAELLSPQQKQSMSQLLAKIQEKFNFTALPPMPLIHKEIPVEAIEAFFAHQVLPLNFPSRVLSESYFRTSTDETVATTHFNQNVASSLTTTTSATFFQPDSSVSEEVKKPKETELTGSFGK